jgi:hypothetical protein
MKASMNSKIFISESGDEIPSAEVISNEAHSLSVEVNGDNQYASLHFKSRLAMYDFARVLLHEALYGVGGEKEFYPLRFQGKLEVVDGVRMSDDSARIFFTHPI